MSTVVEVGQVWLLIDFGRSRSEVKIDYLDGVGTAMRAYYRARDGRLTSVLVSVLRRGRRSARLVRNADGSLVPPPPAKQPYQLLTSKIEARSAGELRRNIPAKCLVKLRECEIEAMRLYRTGMTMKKIDEHFGRTEGTAHKWIDKVRAAEQDAKALGH